MENTLDIESNNITHQVIVKGRNNCDPTICCIKFIIVLLIVIFGLPLVLCDIYFGFADKTCVKENARIVSITLQDYLVVSGISSGLFGFGLLILVIFFDDFDYEKTGICFRLGIILTSVFSFGWNITGGIIFWQHIDNSLCSNTVYNYMYTSLIIKYLAQGFGVSSIIKKN